MAVPGKTHPGHDNDNPHRAKSLERWLDSSVPNRELQDCYEDEEGSSDEDCESLHIRH